MSDLIATKRLTADEFLRHYEDTQQPVQLVNGEVVFLDMAKELHQYIVMRLITLFLKVLENNPLGELRTAPTDVYFDLHNYYQPDLFFVAKDNSRCFVGEDGFWHGAPDLVVEVHSKSTILYDRVEKFEVYERHGVREYWMIDPELRLVEIYQLGGEGHYTRRAYAEGATFTSTVLPQLTITVTHLFPPNNP